MALTSEGYLISIKGVELHPKYNLTIYYPVPLLIDAYWECLKLFFIQLRIVKKVKNKKKL